MEDIPANEITQPLSVLNERAFLIKQSLHEEFSNTWKKLVCFDEEKNSVTIDNDLGKNWQTGLCFVPANWR